MKLQQMSSPLKETVVLDSEVSAIRHGVLVMCHHLTLVINASGEIKLKQVILFNQQLFTEQIVYILVVVTINLQWMKNSVYGRGQQKNMPAASEVQTL